MVDVVDNGIKEIHCEGTGEELFANLGSVVSMVITHMGGDRERSSVLWDFFVKMMQENKETVLGATDFKDTMTS